MPKSLSVTRSPTVMVFSVLYVVVMVGVVVVWVYVPLPFRSHSYLTIEPFE